MPRLFSDGNKKKLNMESVWIEFQDEKEIQIVGFLFSAFFLISFSFQNLNELTMVFRLLFVPFNFSFIYLCFLFLIFILDFVSTFGTWSLWHCTGHFISKYYFIYSTLFFLCFFSFFFFFGPVVYIKMKFPFTHQEAVQCLKCLFIIILWSKYVFFFCFFINHIHIER